MFICLYNYTIQVEKCVKKKSFVSIIKIRKKQWDLSQPLCSKPKNSVCVCVCLCHAKCHEIDEKNEKKNRTT